MKIQWHLIAVAIPFLTISAGAIRGEATQRQDHHHVFEISGFDPRDLVRGYYLQFSYSVERAGGQEDGGCYCLLEQAEKVHQVERVRCGVSPCEHQVAVSAVDGIARYYVPEDKRRRYEKALQDAVGRKEATAKVAETIDGRLQVLELLIDEVPIDQIVQAAE